MLSRGTTKGWVDEKDSNILKWNSKAMNWNRIATHEKHSNNKIAEWEEINPTKKTKLALTTNGETKPDQMMEWFMCQPGLDSNWSPYCHPNKNILD